MEEQDPRLQPSNTYIIPSQPSRGGKAPEVSHRANTHVLITFGLQVREMGEKSVLRMLVVLHTWIKSIKFSNLCLKFQLLLTALKRQKLVSTEERHSKMLDPFVAILTDSLNSKHVKVMYAWIFFSGSSGTNMTASYRILPKYIGLPRFDVFKWFRQKPRQLIVEFYPHWTSRFKILRLKLHACIF